MVPPAATASQRGNDSSAALTELREEIENVKDERKAALESAKDAEAKVLVQILFVDTFFYRRAHAAAFCSSQQ